MVDQNLGYDQTRNPRTGRPLLDAERIKAEKKANEDTIGSPKFVALTSPDEDEIAGNDEVVTEAAVDETTDDQDGADVAADFPIPKGANSGCWSPAAPRPPL